MPERIDIAELVVGLVADTREALKDVNNFQSSVKASFKNVDGSAEQVTVSFKRVDEQAKETATGAIDLAARFHLIEKAYDQVKQTIAGAADLAELGAQSLRVRDRYEKFSATIGDSNEILEAFQRGAGGAVDKLTAMNNAALLIQQGLVGTSGEMEKTVELATRLGNQTLAASDRISIFSQLLRNQSIRLLDDFGISSGRVRVRMQELQKATADLSREEAFKIAVFEEGQKALDILGERQDDYALKIEKAKTKIKDLRIEMGEKLAVVGAKVAEIITSLDSATIIFVTTLTGAVGIAAKFAGGLDKLVEKLPLTGKGFANVGIGVGSAVIAYELYNQIQNKVAEGQDKVNATLDTWQEKTRTALSSGGNMIDVVDTMAASVNEANATLHKNGNVFTDVAASIARTSSENKIMTDAADEVREAILAQSRSVAEANILIKEYNDRVTNSKAKLDEFTTATYNAAKGQNELNRPIAENVLGLADAVLGTSQFTDLLEEQARAHDLATAAAEAQLKVEEEQVASKERLKEAMDLIEGALGNNQDKMDELNVALGNVTEAEVTLRSDLELITRAFEFGAVGVDRMQEALKGAETGTFQLSDAERANYESLTLVNETIKENEAALENQKKAIEESTKAEQERLETQQDAIKNQLALNESLKGADEQQIARTAIKELEKAQQAGLITFDDFTKSVVEIQDKFGLADDESRALTLGLGALTAGLSDGILQASKYDDALGLLIEDAKDGAVNIENLFMQVASLNEELEKLGEGPVATGGTIWSSALAGDVNAQATVLTDAEQARIQDFLARAGGGGLIDLSTMGASAQTAEASGGLGAGITIHGGLHLEGIQDIDDFLVALRSLTPQAG